MSDKTFTVAGTSIKNGTLTNRFANGTAAARRSVLEKDNHSEIKLFDLPNPMTKEDAIAWLKSNSDAKPVAADAPKAKSVQKEVKAKPAVNPKTANGRPIKTGRATSTFNSDYPVTQEEINGSDIVRQIYEAGNNEIVVDAATEAEAMRLHKESVIDFLAWPSMAPAARNEFRLMARDCKKVA
jgi:hypothetical protein